MVLVGKAIDEAIQEKDNNKAEELAQRISESEKQLGPEYLALSMPLETSTLTPRRARRSCRRSIHSMRHVPIKQLSYKASPTKCGRTSRSRLASAS
jgi:hypothetical protein